MVGTLARADAAASRDGGNDGEIGFAADLLLKQREDGNGERAGYH
ncbi:MAG: hypothetical protein ACHQC9_09550 [Alphaproteobacteria bacterium]